MKIYIYHYHYLIADILPFFLHLQKCFFSSPQTGLRIGPYGAGPIQRGSGVRGLT